MKQTTLLKIMAAMEAVMCALLVALVWIVSGLCERTAEHEQTASEETENSVVEIRNEWESPAVQSTDAEVDTEPASVAADLEGVELVPVNHWGQPIDTDYRTTLYADFNIPEDMWRCLTELLDAQDIEFFLPFAVAQIFQESRFDPNAENPNGLDKGLLQYRQTYWSSVCGAHGLSTETPWTDWKAQMFIYVFDAAHRLRQGCSVWETISRHKTSDYGEYDEEYVYQVCRWLRIPNSHDGMEEGYPTVGGE